MQKIKWIISLFPFNYLLIIQAIVTNYQFLENYQITEEPINVNI